MEQVRRIPLADQAAELLFARVRAGEWDLGTRLPSEAVLAPQLGVGRSTVREAIRQLSGRGVVESRHGSGVFVMSVEAPENWQGVLQRSSIAHVLEARSAIESEAAALAAERRTAADLDGLSRALSDRDASRGSIEAHVDADLRFHHGIATASHSPLLLDLFERFIPRVRSAAIELQRIPATVSRRGDQDAHAAILDAITERDAPRAAVLTRDYLNAVKERLR